jgi:aspartate ammonia-lyase
MKSPLPFRLKKLRLEAEDSRVDLSGPTRRERDLLGECDIPVDALYGIQTLRAIESFCISGIELCEFPTLIAALATVKEGAARANLDMKLNPEAMTAPRATPATDR